MSIPQSVHSLGRQVTFTSVLSLQFEVVVEDGGQPPRSDVTRVSLEILRNFYRPTFNASRYNFTILETATSDDVIGAVFAVDDDAKAPHNVITYAIPTNVNPRIHQFFYVEAESGFVQLKRSPLADPQRQRNWGVSTCKC